MEIKSLVIVKNLDNISQKPCLNNTINSVNELDLLEIAFLFVFELLFVDLHVGQSIHSDGNND